MAGTKPSQRTRHDLYEEQKLRQVRNKRQVVSLSRTSEQVLCGVPQLGITPQHRAILEGVYEVCVRLAACDVPSRGCCQDTTLSGPVPFRVRLPFPSAGEAAGVACGNAAGHTAGGGRAGGEGATKEVSEGTDRH